MWSRTGFENRTPSSLRAPLVGAPVQFAARSSRQWPPAEPRTPQGEQMMLPFGARNTTDVLEDGPAPAPSPAPVDHAPGVDDNLDIYTRRLALLDNGELRTGHLRALLDEMGAQDVPLGPYAEQAIRRGDAVNGRPTRGDGRRNPTSWRRCRPSSGRPHRLRLPTMAPAGTPGTASSHPCSAASERPTSDGSFWDYRVFDTSIAIRGRAGPRRFCPAESPTLPRAESTGRPVAMTEGPFLDHIHVQGLPIAFPRHLTAVAGGVTAANALARRNRSAPAAVRLSDIIEARRVYHAGLVAPGSAPPRLVPDTFTLRLQLVSCSPAFALLAALLILDRRHDSGVSVRLQAEQPSVHWRGRALAPLLTCFSAFADHRGWLLSRPPHSGLTDRGLTSTARAIGIASRAGNRVVLDEELFAKLQEDPEARIVYEALLPLEDALHAWLDNLTDPIFAG